MAKRWTEEEIKTLKNDYGRIDFDVLAEKLGRSVDAVQRKASAEGISFKREILIEQYRLIENRLSDIEDTLKRIEGLLTINDVVEKDSNISSPQILLTQAGKTIKDLSPEELIKLSQYSKTPNINMYRNESPIATEMRLKKDLDWVPAPEDLEEMK